MIGNLVGKHDSIYSIRYVVDNKRGDYIRVVFNRDIAYEIDRKTFSIIDMEGLIYPSERDINLMRKVISDKIH